MSRSFACSIIFEKLLTGYLRKYFGLGIASILMGNAERIAHAQERVYQILSKTETSGMPFYLYLK